MSFAELLEAVAYPHHASFDINDEVQARHVVAWLEAEVLHALPEAERAQFGASSAGWREALAAYCAALACPAQVAATHGEAAVEPVAWLVDRAVAKVFSETDTTSWGEELSRGPGSGPVRTPLDVLPDIPAAPPARIRALAAALALPAAPEGPRGDAECLRAVTAELASGFTGRAVAAECARRTAAGASGATSGAPGASGASGALEAGSYPVGFASGDAEVDEFARAARLLYVARMDEVQRIFNEVLAECQEYTADAKTDGSLGKVGF
eukprot:TRINITY_DN5621_c0_g1_i4.p1 TRINITY_DN5621_c0_g1~~TRINITY_DN5621_c0_g1_i4.p1  ORF type:complete len:284 (+),score=111.56 TRINITY_DN5621_c0_g1_i4:50-853(+)